MSWNPDLGMDTLSDFTGGGGGDGAFLGAYEDAAPGALSSDSLPSATGADWSGALSPLAQVFLQGQQVPEVMADSSTGIDYGDWSPADLPGGTQGGGFNAAKDSQAANAALGLGPVPAGNQEGFLQKIMRGMGLRGKDGSVDLSDPKQLQAWMRLILAGGGVLGQLMNHNTPQGYKSPQDLLNSQGGGTKGMTGSPLGSGFFNTPTPAWNQHPFQYARSDRPGLVVSGYAEGGPTQEGEHYQSPGALSAVAGGQDDVIDAELAPGEYVWDADTVAAVGDGDNRAGAKRLDQFRQALRTHKRAAPPTQIPPKTKPLTQYLPKGGQ